MDLVSCGKCGVVLDRDKLQFPDIELEGGSIDTSNSVWDGYKFVPAIDCPVCKEGYIVNE